MRIHCVAIDKVRYKPFRAACDEYLGRLKHYLKLTERELKPGTRSKPSQVKTDEAQRLLAAVSTGHLIVALDERGARWDSPTLAQWLGTQRDLSRPVTFLIGGAAGLAPEVRDAADVTLRLSDLTLPHELARVVLYEQLYRAMTILRGEPYHK